MPFDLFSPFDLGWPDGMEEALFMTVLHEESKMKCPTCGSTSLKKLDKNKYRCNDCGTLLTTENKKIDVGKLREALNNHKDQIKIQATGKVNQIAEENPGKVKSLSDELIELLDDPNDTVKQNSLGCIYNISEEYPGKFKHTIPKIIDFLDSDNIRIRSNAAAVLTQVGKEHPERLKVKLDDIVEYLNSNDIELKINAIGLLGRLAEYDASLVEPYFDEIKLLLEHDNLDLLRNSLITSYHITEEYPEHLEEIKDRLIQLLDSEYDEVKGMSLGVMTNFQSLDLSHSTIQKIERYSDDPKEIVSENAKEVLELVESE